MQTLSKLLPLYGIHSDKIIIKSGNEPPPAPLPNHRVIHIYFHIPIQPPKPKQVLYNDFHQHRVQYPNYPNNMHTTFAPSSDVGLRNIIPYNSKPPLYYQVPMGQDYETVDYFQTGQPVSHPSLVPPIIHRPHPHPTLAPHHYSPPDPSPASGEFIPIPRPSVQYYIPQEIEESGEEVVNYEPKLGFDDKTFAHRVLALPRPLSRPKLHFYSEAGTNPQEKNNLTYPLFKPTPFPAVDISVRPVVEESQEENRRNDMDEF